MVRVVCVGVGLLAASMGCSAVSLGPAQGQVSVGRPLDISIPLSLRLGDALTEGCASAKVFFADQPLSPSNVSTTLATVPNRLELSARVQTSLPLLETFARIEFLVGCGYDVSRAYLLLADAPHQSTTLAPMLVATPSMSVSAPLPTPQPTPSAAMLRSSAVTKGLAPAPRQELSPTALLATQPLLKPQLRLSAELSGVSEIADAKLTQNRETVRLLWRALSDSPEHLAAAALIMRAKEAELLQSKSAKPVAASHAAAVPPAQQPPDTPSGGYDLTVMVGGLLTLTVSAVGLIAALWRQHANRSTQPPWWKGSSVLPLTDSPSYPLDIDFDALTNQPASPMQDSPDRSLLSNGVSRAHPDSIQSALFDNPRSVLADELFDMQQQVEFFMSLGQSSQAIDVLLAHLSDSDGNSPVVYLDLLKLYHEQGQRAAYAAMQQRFNRTFNGSAPDFDGYATSRRGLERYVGTLREIQALWPQPAVVEFIERAILKNTPGDCSEVLDLEAYRELLLLYGIAREVAEPAHLNAINSTSDAAGEPQG